MVFSTLVSLTGSELIENKSHESPVAFGDVGWLRSSIGEQKNGTHLRRDIAPWVNHYGRNVRTSILSFMGRTLGHASFGRSRRPHAGPSRCTHIH